MGVPAFFRWLSRKYPSIVVHCTEEKAKVIDGQNVPIDSSQPNPNNVEFDNLYLDMNGIIHPCCHPENKAAPKDEDEMMIAIFEYIDRIFAIVRPRRLLYMAIDGVAPRAKMNQQRSRRFRASKETSEKVEEIHEIRERLLAKGVYLPPEKPKEEHFDSNCITPGTPFMDRLATCLHYYIHDRLNNDPGWSNIQVILSDANVPGEGEHKIMDYVRKQRANPDHDPNTHHCLCGADADLIMLGLATHEPLFTIIREEFKPNQPRPCEICGQIGHVMKECIGAAKEKHGEFDELEKPMAAETEFIFIRLNVLREYLERDLAMPNLPFPYDFERCIDDWVFMCFFVGNDFLPHLPSLEIREGAIDRLVKLYKIAVYRTGGYLTNSGLVNLARVQLIMTDLGEAEDEIFKRRQDNELAFKRRNKETQKRMKKQSYADKPAWTPGGQLAPNQIGLQPSPIVNAKREAHDMRVSGMERVANLDAAAALRAMLKDGEKPSSRAGPSDTRGEKRKKGNDDDSESEEEPHDEVRLWEDGFKDRYYSSKFEVAAANIAFRHEVAAAYTLGLCWVLRYYYQGCPSWKWYFPYHYAPFASDFVNIGDLPSSFEKGTQPFKPLEQLMGVFPAASRLHVPPSWGELMLDSESPIIDFYPTDFKVDLNGKKFAWQGVALLPFVDEKRLLAALEQVYPLLTKEECRRNVRGDDRLYVRKGHAGYDLLMGFYESQGNWGKDLDLDASLFYGMQGKVLLTKEVVAPKDTLKSPVVGLEDIPNNVTVCIKFRDPKFDGVIFPAVRLSGAKEPPRVLKPGDLSREQNRNWRPQIGMAPARQRASVDISGARMLRHGMQSAYARVPPFQGAYNQQGWQAPRSSYQRSQSQPQQWSSSYGHQQGAGNSQWGASNYRSSRPQSQHQQYGQHGQDSRQNYTPNQQGGQQHYRQGYRGNYQSR